MAELLQNAINPEIFSGLKYYCRSVFDHELLPTFLETFGVLDPPPQLLDDIIRGLMRHLAVEARIKCLALNELVAVHDGCEFMSGWVDRDVVSVFGFYPKVNISEFGCVIASSTNFKFKSGAMTLIFGLYTYKEDEIVSMIRDMVIKEVLPTDDKIDKIYKSEEAHFVFRIEHRIAKYKMKFPLRLLQEDVKMTRKFRRFFDEFVENSFNVPHLLALGKRSMVPYVSASSPVECIYEAQAGGDYSPTRSSLLRGIRGESSKDSKQKKINKSIDDTKQQKDDEEECIIEYCSELQSSSSPVGRMVSGRMTPPYIGVGEDDIVRVLRVSAPQSPERARRVRENGIQECIRLLKELNAKLVELVEPEIGEIFEAQVFGIENPFSGITVSLAESTHETIDDLNDSLRTMIDKIPTMDSIKDMLGSLGHDVGDMLKGVFTKIASELPVMLGACLLTCYSCLVLFMSSKPIEVNGKPTLRTKWVQRAKTLFNIALPMWMTLRLSKAINNGGMSEFIDNMVSTFNGIIGRFTPGDESVVEMFEAQIGLDPSDITSLLSKVVLGVSSFAIVGQVPSVRKTEKFLSLAALAPRALDGIHKGMEYLVWVFQKAVNYIRSNLLGLERFTWFEDTLPEVDRWCRKVEILSDQARDDALPINQYNAVRVRELLRDGNRLLLGKYDNVESSRVRTAVGAYMRTVTKLYAPFEKANFAGIRPRMEPVTIFLYGESGVGKSFLTYPLMISCLARTLPEERLPELRLNYMDMIYSRMPEQKFWDGYRGQRATVFDDFGQVRDAEGVADGEYMDIIRCTNIMPNVLHMAHLDDKGTSVWDGDFILATSNKTSFIDAKSITQPEALHRRFHFAYMVAPRKEFCTKATKNGTLKDRRLDESALKGCGFRSDVYEFHQIDIVSADAMPTGIVISFDQLVDLIVTRHASNLKKSDAMLSDLTGLVNKEVDTRTSEFNAQVDADASAGDVSIAKMPEASAEELAAMRCFDKDIVRPTCSTFRLPKRKSVVPTNIGKFELTELFVKSGVSSVRMNEVATFLRSLHPDLRHCTTIDLLYALSKVAPDFWSDMVSNPVDINLVSDSVEALLHTEEGFEVGMLMSKFLFAPYCSQDLPSLEKARSTLDEWRRYIRSKIEITLGKYPLLKVAGIMLGALTIGSSLYGLYNHFCQPDMMEAESGDKRHTKSRNRSSRSQRIRGAANRALMHEFFGECAIDDEVDEEARDIALLQGWLSQGGGDINSIEMARKVIQKSLYEIMLPGDTSRIGLCVVLKGRVALMPYHYVVTLRNKLEDGTLGPQDELQFSNTFMKSGPYKVRVSEVIAIKEDSSLKERDLATFELPISVHQHANISKYFVSANVMAKDMSLTVHSVILERDRTWRLATGVAKRVGDTRVQYGNYKYTLPVAYRYNFATVRGDCGNLLILNNKSVGPGKIIGMHVAGSGTAGISTPIEYELIQHIISLYPVEAGVCPPDEVIMEAQCMELPFEGNFVPLISVERKALKVPESKIIPSPLYGRWMEAKTAPAVLNPTLVDGVRVDPMAVGVSGYGSAHYRIQELILEKCIDEYSSIVNNVKSEMAYRTPKVFTFEEAVLGIPGEDYVESINRKTSPGFPYILDPKPGFSGKEYWFGKGDDFDLSTPQCEELRNRVLTLIENAKFGVRGFNPYADFPKDERRKLAKVAKAMTRSISSSKMDFSIAFRMFYLDFSVFFMRARFDVFSAVGVNVYSTQWDELARILRVHEAIVAGDYAGFDKNQIVEFLWAAFEVIQRWYDDGEVNRRIRFVLWADVVSSIHVFRGSIYQWMKSLPSGNAFTTIINTIVNILILMYVFVKLGAPEGFGIRDFRRNVKPICYGDDNVISVSPAVRDWFNCVTIGSVVRTFGMDYTDDTKEGVPVAYRTLSEVAFLKRSFRFEEMVHKYVAPLNLEVVLEIAMWTTSGPLEDFISRENVEVTLTELSLHGKEIFDVWAPRIIEGSVEFLDYTPRTVSFKTCLHEMLTTEDVW